MNIIGISSVSFIFLSNQIIYFQEQNKLWKLAYVKVKYLFSYNFFLW